MTRPAVALVQPADRARTLVPGRTPWRVGPVSGVRRPRAVVLPLLLAVLAFLLIAVSTARGDYPLPLADVVRTLLGAGDATDRLVVVDLRLPRALTGLLVGIALGVSGAVTQSLARNPLASPDVLGITQGASAAAVAVIVLGAGGSVGLPLAALAGGLLAAALVVLLGATGGVQGLRIVLVGVGVGAALTSLTSSLLLRAQISELGLAMVWLTGSLQGRGWQHVVPVAVAVAVVLCACLVLAPTLAALRLSEDSARALGLRVPLARGVLLLAAVLLAAAATAAAGPIAFVALVAPQIAARLVGSAGPPLVTSAAVGGVLLLGADLVARTLLPVELPVGVVTAAIGAPYLLLLLVTRTRKADA